MLKFEAYGNNFWGAGFGNWHLNDGAGTAADGTGYEGLSFWARSAPYAEKQFLFHVDDARTIKDPPDDIEQRDENGEPILDENGEAVMGPPRVEDVPNATDLDGDGLIGPGDIAPNTECRLPPPDERGEPTCYKGGVDGIPEGAARVPAPGECGNSFHTRITTTDEWQLILIPWDDLVQWPCPNRLEGGIRHDDIAKFEIKMPQGTHYELYIDNIAFYRRRQGDN
jgi:hypothetical protein